MELLDRYLQAVSKHLPRRRQQDILAELRANLEAQLEDKESALGRPLTQGEAEDWLREIGPPIHVAARYLPQQSLIGPGLFPTYWFVLRTALLWALVIYTVVSAVLIALGQAGAPAVPEAILRVPGLMFTVAAWITLFFAALEFFSARYPQHFAPLLCKTAQWSPASLPPIEKSPHAPRSYAHAVAELIFGFLFLVWLLLLPQYPFLVFGPGAWYFRQSPFQFAPAVLFFYAWFVAFNVFQLVWHSIDFARGAWQRPHPIQRFIFKVFGLIPLFVLLSAPDHILVLLKNPDRDSAQYAANLHTLNQAIHQALLVVLVIVVLQLLWDVFRFFRDAGSRAA